MYLAEYAKQGRLVNIIRYAADTLASVPSIVMGLFGYALFVEAMGLGLSCLLYTSSSRTSVTISSSCLTSSSAVTSKASGLSSDIRQA